MPKHLAYMWWRWDRDSQFREVTFDFTLSNDPGDFSDDYGLYFIICQGRISNHIFYFGLQTDVSDPNQRRGRGKGLIFSRWGERDTAFARVADDEYGWHESAGYEGDFISVRRSYDWGTGDYRMRFAPDGLDADGEWYGLWITELSSGETVWAGSLKFPLVSDTTAVNPPSLRCLRYMDGLSFARLTFRSGVSLCNGRAGNGILATWGSPGYSGSGRVPKPNADVQYDSKADVLHFRIGGITEQVGDDEPIRFR